jgi:predicted RNase H-like HicB family nuclease
MPRRTYHVDYRRDGRFWIATVRGVRGCHTQGRTLEAAKRRIRQALALHVDNAKTATLTETIHLPPGVQRQLAALRTTRAVALAADRRAAAAADRLIRVLSGRSLRLSMRDIAALLNLSHQRVHQLANAE